MVVDSMAMQHAKWIEHCRHIPWHKPIPSLNYLLTSTCWRSDHSGFSHQGPGFIDNLVNKRTEVVRVYLPVAVELCERRALGTSLLYH
jgi:xylulose-5-phosphate/fructose-6-phosphate phosphoketolase